MRNNSWKHFFKEVKSISISFWKWNYNLWYFWFVKLGILLIPVFVIILLGIFIRSILPDLMNILGILFLGYLFIYSSKSKSDNDTEETHTVDEPLCREILFRILNSCACELNILAPKSVLDLIPGNGQCNYVQNNVQFYRYIIRPATGSELTYEEIKNIINLKLNQRLRNGYPNMANTYYKKTLCLYCSDVDIDAYNEYYLYIDILPIVDKTSYQYYEQLQKYNHKKALDNDSIGEIYDKDF